MYTRILVVGLLAMAHSELEVAQMMIANREVGDGDFPCIRKGGAGPRSNLILEAAGFIEGSYCALPAVMKET